MSSTNVLKIEVGKGSESIQELRNSHGSAPVVWNKMCQKYLGSRPFGYHNEKYINNLWPLYKDKSVPLHHRAVLMMTFDRVYISYENFIRAADDISLFLDDFPVDDKYVNHWESIENIFRMKPKCDAIGFHMTSVCENLFEGDWNEEKEDYDNIDWATTFELYSELDE